MGYNLSDRSLTRLTGVHSDLVRVVKRAIQITDIDFTVLEGLRTVARQRQLVAQGASKTMKSRHIHGFAVDLAPMLDFDGDGDKEVSWSWPHYHRLAPFIQEAARLENVPIEWGGLWRSFRDGPHWQLPASRYPDPK